MAESIELATILQTDLVGPTRLPGSTRRVRDEELREEHFGRSHSAFESRVAALVDMWSAAQV